MDGNKILQILLQVLADQLGMKVKETRKESA